MAMTLAQVKIILQNLGWRVNTDARLKQAIGDFQIGWNLGDALAVDFSAGPATQSALKISADRHAKGLKDFSANFDAVEFRCACGGRDASCRRIWVHRALVRACERYRNEMVGPLTIVRGCRCKTQNTAVRGATNSQHLYGTGVDVNVFDVSPSQLMAKKIASGIGDYDTPKGKRVRHIDVRHVWGLNDKRNTTPGVSVLMPARWNYGKFSGTVTRPRLDLVSRAPAPTPVSPPAPEPVAPTPSKEDDMQLTDKVTVTKSDGKGTEEVAYSTLLNRSNYVYHETVRQGATLAAMAAAIKALGATQGLDPDRVEAIIREEVKDALSDLRIVPSEA